MSRHTDELLESAVAFAHDYYTRQEEMLPQLLFQSEDGTPVVVVFPFGNDTEKYAAIDVLRGMLIAHGATSYTVMTEGWASSQSATTRPSLDPNRIEILTIIVVEKSGEHTGVMYQIERGADARVTNLVDTGGEVLSGGTFSRLFEPEP